MTDDLDACAALVAKGDPARWRAVMAAPEAMRARLLPIYAANVEVARAPWVTSEPLIAKMRLQWWRDALEEIAAGGPVRRHEVVTPLAGVIDAEGARLLDRAVAAREWDVDGEAFRDRNAVLDHVDRTAGSVMRVAARAVGAPDGAARDAGRAQGVANLLAAVPALVAKRKHPLPHGDPEAHAVALADGGLAALDRFRAADVPRAARPAFLVLPEAERVLRAIRARPRAVTEGLPEGPSLRDRVAFARRALLNRP